MSKFVDDSTDDKNQETTKKPFHAVLNWTCKFTVKAFEKFIRSLLKYLNMCNLETTCARIYQEVQCSVSAAKNLKTGLILISFLAFNSLVFP